VKIGPLKTRDLRRITAAEMKHTRKTAGHIWTDCKTNTEVAKELNTAAVLDKIQEYRRNGLQHISRMSRTRLTRIIKNYRPKGRRNKVR
jgi:hypothetical protein